MAKQSSSKTKSHQVRFLHEVRRLDSSAQKQISGGRCSLDDLEQQRQQEAKFLEVNWFTLAVNSWDWFKQRGRGFMSVEVLRFEPVGDGVQARVHYFNRSALEQVSAYSPMSQQFLRAIDGYDPFTQILVLLNLPSNRAINVNCFTTPLTPFECWQQVEGRKA